MPFEKTGELWFALPEMLKKSGILTAVLDLLDDASADSDSGFEWGSYHSMQMIFVDKQADRYQRGDVVAFYCGELDEHPSILVKRSVALPGDTVQITEYRGYNVGKWACI